MKCPDSESKIEPWFGVEMPLKLPLVIIKAT